MAANEKWNVQWISTEFEEEEEEEEKANEAEEDKDVRCPRI